MTKQTSKAQAVLIEHDGVHLWHVASCPLCGGEHTHGGGRAGVDDPDDLLGHRVAHCKPGCAYELARRRA